jgi:excisionase family DNA binding protein
MAQEEAYLSKLRAKSAVCTTGEVQKLLGLSKASTFRAIKNGQIPSIRIGKRILIPLAALEAIFEKANR